MQNMKSRINWKSILELRRRLETDSKGLKGSSYSLLRLLKYDLCIIFGIYRLAMIVYNKMTFLSQTQILSYPLEYLG